jgi:alkylated DNA repair dioxygenase AlkB
MSRRHDAQPFAQTDLFGAFHTWPDGFDYREHVVTVDDEPALIEHIQQLPFKPFEFHGFHGKRRVVSFGWRYDYSAARLRPSDELPSFLLPLRTQAAAFAGIAAEDLEQVLINEYASGAGIGWHRDRPAFEDVIAISLGSTCSLRMRRRQGSGWERAAQVLQPCSAYLLRGPARHDWQHSILPVDRLRYSVTFRNFIPDRN